MDDGVFAAQQLHPACGRGGSANLPARAKFRGCRCSHRRPTSAQLAHFLDAIHMESVHAGDQVSGDDGQVGATSFAISTARRTDRGVMYALRWMSLICTICIAVSSAGKL